MRCEILQNMDLQIQLFLLILYESPSHAKIYQTMSCAEIPRVGDDRYKYDGNDPMILDRSALTTHWFPISIWQVTVLTIDLLHFAWLGLPIIFDLANQQRNCFDS